MRIKMPAETALYLATAMLAAVSTDDVTPIITGVHLEKVGKKLRATATDRYRVHEVTLNEAVTTGSSEDRFIAPSHAFKWIARAMSIIAPRRIDRQQATVIITHSRGTNHMTVSIETVEGDAARLQTKVIVGNYPKIGALMDKAEQAERWGGPVSIHTDYLASLKALQPDRYSLPPTLEVTVETQRNGQPVTARPGPVLAKSRGDENIYARALIQPNLMLS